MGSFTSMPQARIPASVVMVMSPASYRVGAFANAARRIGMSLIRAVDAPEGVSNHANCDVLLDFTDCDGSVERIVEFVRDRERESAGVASVLAIDDRGALIAARANAALGIPHNDPDSVLAARDKFVMRERLAEGGVRVPEYRRVPATVDPATISRDLDYPCVVKPLLLSGSRGVIRVNTPDECIAAFTRVRAILETSGMPASENFILVEKFVPGFEVALEGLLSSGKLQPLALFDKPDPLDGPFFEETIYVAPSRLPPDIQLAIFDCAARAANAIGLCEGPVHAELRVDLQSRQIWLIELAGRSIGGLCSSVLEFGAGMGLEELILRHAAGMSLPSATRSGAAAGVMMIPIPGSGILRHVNGREAAMKVPGITGIEITAPLDQPIVPLPEGESYLGFIFARGEIPAEVESSLRRAHARLRFRIDPIIQLRQV